MYAHHQATLAALTEYLKTDKEVIALLLAGSITKGWATESSDVDVVIVKTDAAYQRHLEKRELTYFNNALATYEGGYIDGKFINKQFLYDVLAQGSEVAKSAFIGAKVIFSHDPEIAALLEQITRYPEELREAKIRSFATQMLVWNWYTREAEKRDDRYLLLHATSSLVLFGSRLLLAHNRLFYPYHKWLRRQLQTAGALPENYFALMDALLANPSQASATAYTDAIVAFHDWGVAIPDCFVIFLEESEWNWRGGNPPLHDW